MKILHLVPSLRLSGSVRQLQLLLDGKNEKHDVRIAVLDAADAIDVNHDVIALTGPCRRGAWAWWHLRQLFADWRPDILHVWSLPVLKGLALAAPGWLSRTVLAQPFDWTRKPNLWGLERWLLRRVARVIVGSEAEAALARRHGVFLEKITVIRPGIAVQDHARQADSSGSPTEAPPGPRPARRHIVCIGPLQKHKGFRDAVWALDMLRYPYEDIQLVVVGKGPAREAMEHFMRGASCQPWLRFEHEGCVAEHLRSAEMCWVPSVTGGGTNAALEAMLAGVPVIAARVPNLDGIVVDGQTGLLFAPGDKVGLARHTRRLLVDPAFARQLGAAGRDRARQHFHAGLLVQRLHRLYQELAA